MILHLEKDGTQHPSLAVMPDKKQFASYILLAKAMNLFVQVTDSDRGTSQMTLLGKDKDGFDMDPIYVGTTLASAIDNLSYDQLQQIKTTVRRELNGKFPLQISEMNSDRRSLLKSKR